MDSWQSKLADYDLIRWDESNTELDTPFLKAVFSKGHWAFLSDYVRLRAVSEHGGIYLDADVEVVRDFSPLLDCRMFIGEEKPGRVTTGVFGAEPGHPLLAECMDIIDLRHSQARPYLIAPEVAMLALDRVGGSEVRVLPPRYFYPYNPYNSELPTKELMFQDITSDTYAIHHWGKSWQQGLIERAWKKLERALWK